MYSQLFGADTNIPTNINTSTVDNVRFIGSSPISPLFCGHTNTPASDQGRAMNYLKSIKGVKIYTITPEACKSSLCNLGSIKHATRLAAVASICKYIHAFMPATFLRSFR